MDDFRILYVEDDPINGLIMKKLLGGKYSVEVVENGELALEVLLTNTFHLVLMDINLGNHHMDGTETMKIIKSMKGFEKLPIYAVTSYAMPDDREHFLNQGFDQYFAKPIDHQSIQLAVDSERHKLNS